MHATQLLSASLVYYRRSHLAVGLGVAVATAVITGALLIGDSVRGSLRDLVLEGLGRVDYALVAPQPFRTQLATELAERPRAEEYLGQVDALLMLPASAEHRSKGRSSFASEMTVLGVAASFAAFDESQDAATNEWDIADNSIWLTRSLAEELSVQLNDEIVLQLPSHNSVPADSPLGEKAETTAGLRVKVTRILPASGLARFSLQPSQKAPRNGFVNRTTLQNAMDLTGRANVLIASAANNTSTTDDWLADNLHPRLDDLGLQLKSVQQDQAVQIESNQLVLPPAVVQAAQSAWGAAHVQPCVTYLANTLQRGERQIAYSTVTGIQSTAELGPLVDEQGQPILLGDNDLVLNHWAAEQLEAAVGDTISLTYYQPESTHALLQEAAPLLLKLVAIVPLAGKAADPNLTPTLAGVTDAQSINDWDLPFELVEPITPADEDYWDQHSTTPKAFIALSLAEKHWQTRWGSVSLMRAAKRVLPDKPADALLAAIPKQELGLAFRPVKRLGLQAAAGTTPFDGLFFGFSLFLIASAVMLIALLFRLGIDQRAREIGLLSACGWQPNKVRRQLLWEGAVVADQGAAVGLPLGVVYAWLMLAGLRTIWVAAVAAPFMQLHLRWQSLLLGYAIGIGAALFAIGWSLRGLRTQSTRSLLAGQAGSTPLQRNKHRARGALTTTLLAIAFAVWGSRSHGETQAGLFFGSGACVLLAIVLKVRGAWLTRCVEVAAPVDFGLSSLALRNVMRNQSRSLLTIALVGAASFLILAISAFQLPPTTAGTGGFDLLGVASQPLHYDLNTPEGRFEYGFTQAQSQSLAPYHFQSLRVYDGEDASCLNLYQTQQPRVLGVPASFAGDFAFAATRPSGDNANTSPFALLNQDLGNDAQQQAVVPVMLDFNTAMYSLKLYRGVGERFTIRDSANRSITVEVVALLKNSMLQGDLLVSEHNFLQLFPETGGYRMLLVEGPTPETTNQQVARLLEDQLSDFGLDMQASRVRLADFLAVQNTYLSTFQTLGMLGLLLGVVGVAVVQLRSVAQRRGELALLRASGFSQHRVTQLIFYENVLLLLSGLASGAVAATVALVPQATQHDARPPWLSAVGLVAFILLAGVWVGWLATRRETRSPIVPALRAE